jgi:AcrR family transcriptional regulator
MSNRDLPNADHSSTAPRAPAAGRSSGRAQTVGGIAAASTSTRAGGAGRGGVGREQAILDAAARLFHVSGFDGVGVDEIGQLAGVSGPAIYRYFSGKDEILATLFDAAMDRLLLLCGQLPEEPSAALDRLVEAHVEFVVRDSALLSVYTREERSLADPWRRRLNRRQRDHLGRWVAVLRRCFPNRPAGEHRAAAYAVIGMIHSVAQWPGDARRGVDLTEVLPRWVKGGLSDLGQRGNAAPAG